MRKKSIFAIFMAVVMMMLAMPVSVSAVANHDAPTFNIEVKNDCCVDKEEFGKFWDCQCTVTKTVNIYGWLSRTDWVFVGMRFDGYVRVSVGGGAYVYMRTYVRVYTPVRIYFWGVITTKTVCVSCGRVINSSV